MWHKKRILFFPFNLLSHYLRCIVLANKYYDKEKYEVLFLSSSHYNSFVEQHGYKTFACKQFDAKTVMACSEKFNFSWLNVKDIETVLLDQVKVIRQLKPDIVIGDVAPALKMAAELTSVEYVALTNGYLTKYYVYTRKLSRTHKAYKYAQKIPDYYFDRITAFAERLSFKIVHRPFKLLRKKYKLKTINNYLSEMEGDKNLICDTPLLFPQKPLPQHYHFIDPLIYQEKRDESQCLNTVDKTKPVICICMGSTGNWEKLNFLNDSSYSCYSIITAGDKAKILTAPHISAHSFVNLEQVLNITQLMICHGGNGTIYYGLMKGVYMLCLTNHFEQEWNVHALERTGFGRAANDFTYGEWKYNIAQSLKIKLKPLI